MRVILASCLKLFTDKPPLCFAVCIAPQPFLDGPVMNHRTVSWEPGPRTELSPRCILSLQKRRKNTSAVNGIKLQQSTSFQPINGQIQIFSKVNINFKLRRIAELALESAKNKFKLFLALTFLLH